jgi:RHS repeat-associated protein
MTIWASATLECGPVEENLMPRAHSLRSIRTAVERLARIALAGAVLLGSAPGAWAGITPLTPAPSPPGPPPPPGCGQNPGQCCPQGTGGKPVDLWNGREFFTHTDLVLPGLMDIAIQRSYDSLVTYDSALGYGWALNYFMRIYEYADGSVTLRRDCGVKRGFVSVGGAYQTPVGETGTLVKNADLSWTYTEKSGEQKQFDAEGRLSAIVSPQGPYLLFSYDSRGKLPLIGLSPYGVDSTPKEIAREYRLLRLDEYATGGQATGRFVMFTYDDATGRLTALSDSASRTVSYQHDGNGNLTQVGLPEGGVLNYDYQDPADPHNATTLTDSACPACGGGAYLNTYDSQDRVVRQEHGTNVMRFTYVQAYTKTIVDVDVTDDQGNPLFTATTTYEFNGTGNPTKVTDALGHQKITEYDGNMNPTREERWENTGTPQAPNLVLRYVEERTYDSRGNLLTLTEAKDAAEQRLTTYTYDAGNHLLTITLPSVVTGGQNKVTTFTYDPAGNVLTHTETGLLGDSSAYSYVTTYTYDGNGRRTSIDGPRTDVSDVTTFASDAITGNLSMVTQPGSLVTTYSNYTATGQPQTVTDPNGVATTYTYDALGRVLTATVGGGTTIHTYTPTGKIATITLPRGNVTTYSYDTLDRLATIQDGLGSTITYTYDSMGNRIREEVKDPGGALQRTVSFQHDVLNRLFRATNPGGSFTEYQYAHAGNQKSVKDPNGNTTSFSYDPLDRLKTATQPGSVVTSYGYNLHGDLVTVTNAVNHVTTYTPDDMGRVYREISPDTGTTTFGYDPAGNRTSKTDARGITVTYEYDALNRLKKADFPTDTDVTYTYDTCTNGKTRLCQVVDQSGTTSYSYSVKGELLQESQVILGVTSVTGYSYDANSNPQTITYPSLRTVTYSYDNADRVTTVTTTPSGGGSQTVATAITHKPFGGIASLTYGNGLLRTVTYDQQYRISRVQTGGVLDLAYGFDNNGNILSLTNNLDTSKNKTYGYDALDRLQGATGPWGSLGWTYDKVGNRLSQTGADPSTYTYTSGTDRLSSVMGALNKTLGYDANGNTTADNSRIYTYNQNNRMIQAFEGGILGSYTHNAREQRVTKTVGATITIFHHDPQGQIIAETQDGLTTVEYLYLDGQPLAKADSTGVTYVHVDHLGTPVSMTNSAGTSVWEIEARPFGDNATITGSGSLSFRFPGQYADQETGLNQNGWREYSAGLGRYVEADPLGVGYHRAPYYDPQAGRFISENPVASSSGLHYYQYAMNSPIDQRDPLGLITRKQCLEQARDFYDGCLRLVSEVYEGLREQCFQMCSVAKATNCLTTCLGAIDDWADLKLDGCRATYLRLVAACKSIRHWPDDPIMPPRCLSI